MKNLEYNFQSEPLNEPSRIDNEWVEHEYPVTIESEGQQVAAEIFFPSNKKSKHPAVIFAHGWRGDQLGNAEYAQELAAQGYVCLTFDFRGHGQSDGDITTLSRSNFLHDAMAAYDYLASVPEVDKENISLTGSSFGCYIGTILSSNRKLKSLVLRVPADYPDDGFDEPRMQTADQPGAMKWRGSVRDKDDTKALRSLQGFAGEILIVESGKDEAVPHGTIQSYLNAASDKTKVTHVVMENAPHGLGYDQVLGREFAGILSGWFKPPAD